MKDSEPMLLTIGQLAKVTGVPVRTIRFYSDAGLVEPSARTASGYRLYDAECAARLDLVRTLRDLGIDLPTVARVLAREVTVAEVARTHADALDATVRVLRLRQAVLRAAAVRGSDWKDMELMHRLARLDATERARILDGFLDRVFEGLGGQDGHNGQDAPGGPGGEFEAMIRSVFPQLPEEPTEAQVDAWVELVALIQDEDFTARIRTMAVRGVGKRAAQTDEEFAREQAAFGQVLATRATEAVAEGIDPGSQRGARLAGEIAGDWCAAAGFADTPERRAQLLADLETFTDRRVDRFWALVAAVGQSPHPQYGTGPTFEAMQWLVTAFGKAQASG